MVYHETDLTFIPSALYNVWGINSAVISALVAVASSAIFLFNVVADSYKDKDISFFALFQKLLRESTSAFEFWLYIDTFNRFLYFQSVLAAL